MTSSSKRLLPKDLETAVESLTYDPSVAQHSATPAPVEHSSRASNRGTFLQRLLLIADLVSAGIGGIVAALVVSTSLLDGAVMCVAVMAVWSLLSFVCGLYNVGELQAWASGLADAPRTMVAALLLAWPILGIAELVGIDEAIIFAVVASAATVAIDSIARALSRGFAHRIAPLRQRTVLVGSGMVADKLVERLERHGEFGLETIGLVDDDVHILSSDPHLPKLGSLSQLPEVLDERQVDRVIIAFSRASHQELLSAIRICRDRRINVDIVPRLFELVDAVQAMSQIGGLPLISIGAPPLSAGSRLAKRLLDLLVSTILLLLLSPILLLIAIAIKLDSRGPVFFRQIRAGRDQKPFKVIKFRTMFKDADERKAEFEKQNEATDGVMFKIKKDPRITRVGTLLRKTSLDELPQLINVLTGEMSLVGPRPLILSEAEQAAQSWHARRLDLRPGITGLWQVSGRSDLPFLEMVRFDYQYVSGWSLARDIEILLATIPVVLSRRGAY
jgi:exopolysaccharide biosynthesis polyprenyl glycosylphosphotransferase